MPPIAYRAVYVLSVAIGPRRRRARRLLAAAPRLAARRRCSPSPCSAALAVVVRINLQFTQPQGRYLLPGLPAFAVLIAIGLRAGPPPLTRGSRHPSSWASRLLTGNLYALVVRSCCRPTTGAGRHSPPVSA